MADDLTTVMDALTERLYVRPYLSQNDQADCSLMDSIPSSKLGVSDSTGLMCAPDFSYLCFGQSGAVVALPTTMIECHSWIGPSVCNVFSRRAKAKMMRVDASVSAAAVVAGVENVGVSGVTMSQHPDPLSGCNSFAVDSDRQISRSGARENNALVGLRFRRLLEKILNLSVRPHCSHGEQRVTVSVLPHTVHYAKTTDLLRGWLFAPFNITRGTLAHG